MRKRFSRETYPESEMQMAARDAKFLSNIRYLASLIQTMEARQGDSSSMVNSYGAIYGEHDKPEFKVAEQLAAVARGDDYASLKSLERMLQPESKQHFSRVVDYFIKLGEGKQPDYWLEDLVYHHLSRHL